MRRFCTRFLCLLCTYALFAQDIDPKKALGYEISTATKKELIAIAVKEGLSISGSETDLRNRLYAHYDVEPPSERKVTLKNAQSIYSGRIASLNETTTRLSGGVEIEIKEGTVLHKIKAENLIIYQKSQTIYASGAVRYVLEQASGTQVFNSKNMTFNTKKWQALFVNIHGSTKFSFGTQEDVEFYLTAKKIQKTASGLVILDGVTITSCNEEADPHYQFKFTDMWVLSEKEAVVKNMTMYMGHVPVFYLPFYYHGQDVLPFNPVIGYRNPAGIFFNTTTYLYGEKPASDGGTSMFNVMGAQSEDDMLEQGYLKFMADLYSMLGVFGGLGGYIPVMNTTFTLGVAYSRTIFDGVSLFSGEFPVVEEINTSNWFGKDYPFRFGVNLAGEVPNLTFAIQSYSDPYFAQDFFFREENATILGFLGGLSGENPFDEIFTTDSYLRYENEWNFSYPGLKTFAIDYLNFELNSTVKDNLAITNAFSPNQYFYVPKTVNFPNLQMRLEGDWIFGTQEEEPEEVKEQTPQEIQKKLRDEERKSFLEKNNLALLQLPGGDRDFEHSFFYRWQVNERLYYEPYTSLWDRPTDVRMTFDDVRSLTATRLNFGVQSTTTDSYFVFRQGAQLDLQYQQRFNESAAVDPDSAKKSDQSNRFMILSNVTELGYYPLLDFENWEQTGIEYNLTARVFENIYDAESDFRKTGGTFKPDVHMLRGQVRYDNGNWWGYVSADLDIPPDVLFKSNSQSGLGFEYWGFSMEAYVYLRQNFQDFDSTGYGLKASYSPIKDFSLYQSTEMEFTGGFHDVKVGMELYGFTAELAFEQKYLWDFNRAVYTWVPVLTPDGVQDHGFGPSYLNLELLQDVTVAKFWDDRGRFLLSFNGQWLLDFVRYNDSILRFGLGVGFEIDDLVTIRLSTNSINRATHLYIPFMRDKLGITGSYNFFSDLWDSFKFWDPAARQRSNFKLENIEASVMFDLHDWVIGVVYVGGPNVGAFSVKESWTNELSFLVTWKAISPLKMQANYDDDYGLYLGSTGKTR